MTFSATDLDRLLSIVRDAARVEIMPRFARLTAADVKVKAHASDFVTVADEAAERFIETAVRDAFGEVAFVGEEVMERDATVIDRIPDAPLCIVIDPIDGTFNYANGIPAFAVIASVIEHGRTVAGIILDPVRDDAAVALVGGGAFGVAGDGVRRPLKVAKAEPLRDMHGMVSWTYMEEPLRGRVLAGLAGVWGAYNYRCGGQEMRLVASGGAHFTLYHKLTPWDHAAGELIHREAGGHAAKLDGAPYRASDLRGGLLLAPDAESWTALHRQLVA
ncbi:MAG TPA: inositol monophosphatase [Methylomirabilota bacterium]|nr:inositol monophosphatase [Methylomirabilota bacterium]